MKALRPRGETAATLLGLLAWLAFGSTAWSTPPDAATIARTDEDARRVEIAGAPVLMANSDLGVGVGAMASIARLAPGPRAFSWKLEALAFVTIKSSPNLHTVFHDDYLKLELPRLAGNRVRLTTMVGFSRHSNTGYYGLGNLAPVRAVTDPRYHQYDRIYPQALVRTRIALWGAFELMLGGSVTYNWVDVYEESKLAEDLASDASPSRDRLSGVDDHVDVVVDLGVVWDTLDHAFTPSDGYFHELSFRLAPTAGSDARYAGATLALRLYRRLVGRRLVLAARVLLDVLLGDAPLYELARHGGLSPAPAPGGGQAVRGIPAFRYHGKIKLLSNLELRGFLPRMTVLGQRVQLGGTCFVDSGRVWSDFDAPAALDGRGLGIKSGVGAGLRLLWGGSLLLRADVAWSADADPVGVYFNVNHAF